MHIILGLIGIALSFLLIVYRSQVKHFIGNIEWAERRLGPGGTYSLLVIVAILMFFISLMYMTSSFDLFFGDPSEGIVPENSSVIGE